MDIKLSVRGVKYCWQFRVIVYMIFMIFQYRYLILIKYEMAQFGNLINLRLLCILSYKHFRVLKSFLPSGHFHDSSAKVLNRVHARVLQEFLQEFIDDLIVSRVLQMLLILLSFFLILRGGFARYSEEILVLVTYRCCRVVCPHASEHAIIIVVRSLISFQQGCCLR